MANSELPDREADLSKKDRLINAWLAAGPDAMAKNIAEITDSSVAYASRIESQMEEGEIGEDDVEAVRDEALVDEYADRLERIAQEEEEGDASGGESPDATGDTGSSGTEAPEEADQRQPSVREARRQHQERQQEAARERETGQHPPQRWPSGQSGQQPQQSREAFPADAEGSVPVERLRELDELLAAFEEEAQFEVQHLPQSQAAEAVGKLFVAGKTRSLLREAVEENGDEETQ